MIVEGVVLRGEDMDPADGTIEEAWGQIGRSGGHRSVVWFHVATESLVQRRFHYGALVWQFRGIWLAISDK